MTRTASIVLILAAACSVGAAASVPAEREHRVARGESASLLAKRYYGEADLAPLLLAYNDKRGTVLHVGETLRIPACPEHEVQQGDTGSVLSRRYLGRSDAWPIVARLNGIPPAQALRVGQSLVFPVILRHEMLRGETLAVVAERYYGDPMKGGLLREFNGIDEPRRLSVGRPVEVPLVTLRLVDPPPRPGPSEPQEAAALAEARSPVREAAPETPVAPPPPPLELSLEAGPRADAAPAPVPAPEPVRYSEPLREAAAALAHGRYEDARERLEALREPVESTGSLEDRVALWRLFLGLHVAYDEANEACAAHRSLAALDAPTEADPDTVSPRVRETIEQCELR